MPEDSKDSIDLNKAISKIKSIFSPKNEEPEKSDKSVTLNISEPLKFIKKNYLVFLILIPLIFSIGIRMQPKDLPFTDNWAKATVENNYKSQILQQINQQYPTLPSANKNALAQQQFDQYLKQNRATVDGQTRQVSQGFKAHFQDNNGRNYMPDIDPYVYLRYAENYLNHGFLGDEKRIVDGKQVQWDTHQIAPLGAKVTPKTLHPYALAYLQKIMSVFSPGITPMDSASYFPIIFAALSIIPAFFIGRKLGGNVGGFFAAMMIAVSPSFIGRSLYGHADTDAYNIFFPLFIVWLFLESFEQKDRKKSLMFAGAAGIITGIYSLAWNGWWYVFDFILGMIGIYLIYLLAQSKFNFNDILKNESIKSLGMILGIFLVSSAVFVSLLNEGGISSFINAPIQPLSFSKLKIAAHETLWPNVYTTVAELNPASVSSIINSVGSRLLFAISLIGVLFMIFGYRNNTNLRYGALIVLWYIGIFYASTKGVRFTMMLVPPFALAFGVALGKIYEKSMQYMKKEFDVGKTVTSIVLLLIFAFLLISPTQQSIAAAKSDLPIINDAWYDALNSIKINSSSNAIVNSWWDFGHHFKYYADRAVTFDGGSQNTPMAHWIGKALLTDDEDLAVGILRMLDCGSNTAFDKLNAKVNDTSVSVKILYDVVKMSKLDAQSLLMKKGLSKDDADEVLKYTHCSPPEDYFITSDDMVGKAGVWAHFGSWDFDRADIVVYAKNLPLDQGVDFIVKNQNVSNEKARQLYFEAKALSTDQETNNWIAPWPSYAGVQDCSLNNDTVVCNNGIKINVTSLDVTLPTAQGTFRPHSLVYATKDDVIERFYNSTFPYSIALTQKNGNYQVIIMQPELAKSMFTRLFFFQGYQLKHFNVINYQKGLVGTEIYVWKVKWS